MVQIVLMSERAGELVDLGKSRLNALRQQGRSYASSYLATRYGYIIAQILGSTERLLLDNKPPYLFGDFIQYIPEVEAAMQAQTGGGVTGEVYIRTETQDPPELSGITTLQSSQQYVTTGRYAFYVKRIAEATYEKYAAIVVEDLETHKVRFVYGQDTTIIGDFPTFTTFAPLGRDDNGGEFMAYSFRYENPDDTEDTLSVIFLTMYSTNDQNPPQISIWPSSDDNGGYVKDIETVRAMTNAGRMRIAFIQNYRDTTNDDGDVIHEADDARIIVMDLAETTYTSTTIRSLSPELEAFADARPELKNRFANPMGIVYCGNSTILVCVQHVAPFEMFPMYVFRTTDGGSSWSEVDVPFVGGEFLYGSFTTGNNVAFRSLEPGKVMMTTQDRTTDRLRVYFSENYGATWTSYGIMPDESPPRYIGYYLPFLQAPHKKYGKEFVYTSTMYGPDAGKIRELVFSAFHPSAEIEREVFISDNAPTASGEFVAARSAYAERGAPLLQGYVNELEGAA